jgi:hypothetical protein
MSINDHPASGTILVCDFNGTFKQPEMVKPRCVIVLSPRIEKRAKLCTVVYLSTTDPNHVMPFHCRLDIRPALPRPWDSDGVWVKGDMIYSVGFRTSFASPLLPEQPPLFAVPVPRLFGFALIVQLLSAGERDFDFCPAFFVEVNF